MDSALNRRRRLVVDGALQGRIVLRFTTVPLVVLGFTALAMVVLVGRVFREVGDAGVVLPSLLPLVVTVVLFLFASGGVIAIQALRYSHRIAGPMHRMVQSMRRVQSGVPGIRVSLRAGDELTSIADELNKLFGWIESPDRGAAPPMERSVVRAERSEVAAERWGGPGNAP